MITPEQELKIQEWQKQNNIAVPSAAPKQNSWYDQVMAKTKTQAPQPTPTQGNEDVGINGNLFQGGGVSGLTDKGAGIANAVTHSEQNFGKDIAQATYLSLFGGQKNIDNITKSHLDNATTLTNLALKQTDQAKKDYYRKLAESEIADAQKVGGAIIGNVRTPKQIVGDAIGVGVDLALVGNPLPAAKGIQAGAEAIKVGKGALDVVKAVNAVAPSFKLLNATDKANLLAKGIATAEAYEALSTADKLKYLAVETGKMSAKGAGVGYGMDVSKNLEENKSGGQILSPGVNTVIGAATPLTIGGIKMTTTALKNPTVGGKVIDTLIKPLQKDLAYGKEPGKVIAKRGIVGNNLDDLGQKVYDERLKVGKQLGQMTASLEGKTTIDLGRATEPIDNAIEQAEKTPEVNKAIIERLNMIKRDLVNYIGGDQKNLTFAEGIDAKGTVGDLTKWTGNPTDDKIVNSALKQTYDVIDGEIMKKVGSIDPQIAKNMSQLNDDYGSLISAKNAIDHREILLQRQGIFTTTGKAVGTATALGTSILGGGAIAPILSGITVATLEKILRTTAVQTRIVKWLSKESTPVINKVYQANPAIRNILIKLHSSSQD